VETSTIPSTQFRHRQTQHRQKMSGSLITLATNGNSSIESENPDQ
jgi:hypothetical protein